MSGVRIGTSAVTLLLSMAVVPVAAQWLNLPTPGIPRTSDGKPDLTAPAPRGPDGRPDLTGVWITRSVKGDLADRSQRSGVDPKKLQPWARARMHQHVEHFFKDNPEFSCRPRGPAEFVYQGISNGGMRRIVQHPTLIAILNDSLTYRQVFLDGRTLEPAPHPSWMGYSVGRWNGDTLVVESAGFNDKTWLNNRGVPHTDALRISERWGGKLPKRSRPPTIAMSSIAI